MFVILDNSDLEMDDRIRIGIRALSGCGLDVDILVMTSSEVEVRKNHPSTLTHKILTEGKKLYDKRQSIAQRQTDREIERTLKMHRAKS